MSEKKQKKPKSKVRSIIEWTITGLFAAVILYLAAGYIDGMIHQGEHYGTVLRFGWGSSIVLTDSMENPQEPSKGYQKGSALVTYNESGDTLYDWYNQGKTLDIVFFNAWRASQMPDPKDGVHKTPVEKQAVFVHRVFKINLNSGKELGQGKYTFFVAGTNTAGDDWREGQYQAFSEKELLGIVKLNSPVLGWVYRGISSIWGLLILLLLPATYLVIVSMKDIFAAMKEPGESKPSSSNGGANLPGTPVDPNDPLAGLSEADRKRLQDELIQQMINDSTKGGKK